MADIKDVAELKPFDASDYHVGVVVGLFNGHITGPMKELVMETLIEEYQVLEENIKIVEVAGAADMPAVLEVFAKKKEIDCIIALGAIIRGETAHFEYVSKIATDAVREVQVKHAKPVAFGILTTNTEAQARERIPHASGYTAAALHTAKNIREIS